MKKVVSSALIFALMFSLLSFTESLSAVPKKKSSLEKRMKKQNKKKEKKGDNACPKLDC